MFVKRHVPRKKNLSVCCHLERLLEKLYPFIQSPCCFERKEKDKHTAGLDWLCDTRSSHRICRHKRVWTRYLPIPVFYTSGLYCLLCHTCLLYKLLLRQQMNEKAKTRGVTLMSASLNCRRVFIYGWRGGFPFIIAAVSTSICTARSQSDRRVSTCGTFPITQFICPFVYTSMFVIFIVSLKSFAE